MTNKPPPDKKNDFRVTDLPNARLGLVMFAIYTLAYAGFMGMCTFALPTMAEAPWGVNWAIIYGMGLILGAFVLAVIYMFACPDEGRKDRA